jgi:hypothetical protein
MKVLSKIVLGCVLFSGASAMAFAADMGSVSYDYSASFYTPPITNIVDVPVTQEVRDWFTHHGVDGNLIEPSKATSDVKANIDRLLAQGIIPKNDGTYTWYFSDAVNSLVRPALEKALQGGSADAARMIIGDRVFQLTAVKG